MSPRFPVLSTVVVFTIMNGLAQEWQWAKAYGQGSQQDHGRIATDTIGNLYLTGYFSGDVFGSDSLTELPRIPFLKMNNLGEVIWLEQPVRVSSTSCGTGTAFGAPYVAVHPAGSAVYFTGTMCSSWDFGPFNVNDDTNGAQVYLTSYDANGNCSWARSFGSPTDDHVESLHCSPTGEVLLTYTGGATIVDGISVPSGVSVLKFDASGQCQWATQVPFFTGNFHVAEVEDGFYVTGRAHSGSADTLVFDTVQVDVSVRRFVLVKYNYDGHALWGRSHGENMIHSPPPGVGAIAANNTGVLVSGGMSADTIIFGTDTLAGGGELFFIRYGPDGAYEWSLVSDTPYGDVSASDLVMGHAGDAYALCRLKPTLPGTNVDVAGCAQEFDSYDYDSMYLVHLDQVGDCIQSVFTRTNSYGSGPGPERGRWSLVLDATEQPVVCGQFRGTAVFGSTTLSSGGNNYDVYVGKLDALTGVNEPRAPEGHDLLIYANPNQGSFRIKVPTALRNERDLVLSVYDNSGRLVRAQQLDMSGEDPRMDVFGMGPGLYQVTLSKDDRIYHGSMVVE